MQASNSAIDVAVRCGYDDDDEVAAPLLSSRRRRMLLLLARERSKVAIMGSGHDTRSDIESLWHRIECAFARYPALRFQPSPPATNDAIQALEKRIGRPLPADYIASLRIHAGFPSGANPATGDIYTEPLVTEFLLFEPEVVISQMEFLRSYTSFPAGPTCPEIRDVYYSPGWVPVVGLDENGAAYACIDLDPVEPERRGQIIWFCTKDDEHFVEAENFTAFLEKSLVRRLENEVPNSEDLVESGLLHFD